MEHLPKLNVRHMIFNFLGKWVGGVLIMYDIRGVKFYVSYSSNLILLLIIKLHQKFKNKINNLRY